MLLKEHLSNTFERIEKTIIQEIGIYSKLDGLLRIYIYSSRWRVLERERGLVSRASCALKPSSTWTRHLLKKATVSFLLSIFLRMIKFSNLGREALVSVSYSFTIEHITQTSLFSTYSSKLPRTSFPLVFFLLGEVLKYNLYYFLIYFLK